MSHRVFLSLNWVMQYNSLLKRQHEWYVQDVFHDIKFIWTFAFIYFFLIIVQNCFYGTMGFLHVGKRGTVNGHFGALFVILCASMNEAIINFNA